MAAKVGQTVRRVTREGEEGSENWYELSATGRSSSSNDAPSSLPILLVKPLLLDELLCDYWRQFPGSNETNCLQLQRGPGVNCEVHSTYR